MGFPATNPAAAHQQTSSTVINNLPDEVFHIIIQLALRETSYSFLYYEELRALRLVSTSWSALIDNCPQFWSIINSGDLEPVWRMALEKSKQAEIDVDCANFNIRRKDIPTKLTKAIVIHLPRVRTLSVLYEDFVYLIENVPAAPRLRSLELNGDFLSGATYGPIALPFHPAQWAPCLRDVVLTHPCIDWAQLLWSNLESLRVVHTADALPMGEIFMILAASPGLRSLFLQGSMEPSHRRPISTVKLEALESLTFLTDERRTTFDALQSIIASPTGNFVLALHASQENLPVENLWSIGKFASCIADGDAGSVLSFTSRTDRELYKMEMGNFRVILRDRKYAVLDLSETLTRLVEGLPPQRRLAVKTVDMTAMESTYVLGLLPVISSFFPNASHLIIPTLDGNIASRIGGHNNGWIFPHLEFLSITHYRGGRHALKAIEPRWKALESGEQLARLKSLTLTFFSEKYLVFDHEGNVPDQGEIAELGALVPEIIVNRPGD